MLVELAGFKLSKTVYAFWFFADGLVLFVFGKGYLRVFAGVFLDVFFESHGFVNPLWYDHGANVAPEVFEIVNGVVYGICLQGNGACDGV